MRRLAVLAAVGITLATASGALAAEAPERRIMVTGTGRVNTPPDVGVIAYSVRGEGLTADAANQALVDRRRQIEQGLGGLAGARVTLTNSNLNLAEVRATACTANRAFNAASLSVGDCAITGYVAQMEFLARVVPADAAGTAVGLVGRYGATNPRMNAFELSDPVAAQRRAAQAALTDARAKAQNLAAGSGVQLGDLISVSDQAGLFSPLGLVDGQRLTLNAPAPPAPPTMAPINISVTPGPILTQSNVSVVYGIRP